MYHGKLYKSDELVIRQIIHNNIRCEIPDHNMQIVIYFKICSLNSLVIRNAQTPQLPDCIKN